ncbi:zinc transport system substrate-binding protein [Trueperella bonasi]|uniref:Zinc transport system substrate-binding protein n=1 Tax=Trueperella bonasi TaxID=312286 RepID=A0ABT9NJN3_9ACTO|nr:metal ABC transporter substrate-binding protein [Trueperella bonasi]MDP9807033.1 zinc transport system substrate-binding protein [Trueperella bonasi]
MNTKKILGLFFAGALALSACSDATEETDGAPTSGSDETTATETISVTTSFYPLTFLVEEIGGENVEITDLTPPGADAHGVELSPREVADLENSDLVLYIEKLSPAIDSAIEASEKEAVNIGEYVNLLPYEELGGDPHHHHDHEGDDHAHEHDDHDHDGDDHAHEHDDHDHDGDDHAHEHDDHDHGHDHDHGTHDPHFWTDPNRMILAADQVATELIALDPDNEETYTANLDAVKERLQAIADELDSFNGLQCRTDTFLVSHKAFAYLALEGGLNEIGIAGFDPEIEPSPARVREVAELAEEHDLDTVFATSDGEVKTATAIGDEADLAVEILDPAATQRNPDMDYIEVMEQNLEVLRKSMGC